ncbi:MAG: hypothetical protein IJV37_08150, partial [Bacteroidales bacterium]|nr:hypothetical protein [Bacteroidales bacterium]
AHRSAPAARQLPAATAQGASHPGGNRAAVITPAENGIETATISFSTTISIEFLPKYALFS